jgi:hypothetical protein
MVKTGAAFMKNKSKIINIKEKIQKNNIKKISVIPKESTCVICGEYCPEGTHVCINCQKEILNT